ncbi:hypothetical protein [Flocculibacter collagenilyticus]|uniref:hypothetical protein n=1 Tax=Flocculibacter collagenilyticus TaxID=2744479 RepID=UPI0018F342F1|nr:hypothetical protein [Flocculibacter collagenilyticus]
MKTLTKLTITTVLLASTIAISFSAASAPSRNHCNRVADATAQSVVNINEQSAEVILCRPER